ncbi:hypothetical protein CCH79_00015354, partial [Gambusia affinis]
MGMCLPCLGGAADDVVVTPDPTAYRGVKNPEAVERKRKKQEETEKQAMTPSVSGGGGLKQFFFSMMIPVTSGHIPEVRYHGNITHYTSSRSLPALFLDEVTLVVVGVEVGVGEEDGEGDEEGDEGTGGAGDMGDGGDCPTFGFGGGLTRMGKTQFNSPKSSDSKRHVSPTPTSRHQARKLAVLSRAKKEPEGALCRHAPTRSVHRDLCALLRFYEGYVSLRFEKGARLCCPTIIDLKYFLTSVLLLLRSHSDQETLRHQSSNAPGKVFLHGQQAGFMSTGEPLVVLLHVCQPWTAELLWAHRAAHGRLLMAWST